MKIVVVSGGFDPVHSGHIAYLKMAREHGDKLIVALNSDNWLKKKKGKPFMKEREREYIMSRVKGVTKTFVCNPRSATDKTVCDGIYSAVNTFRREYDEPLSMAFGNGGDRGKGNIPEEDYCNSMGVDMVWGLGDKVQSSSWLIEKALNSAV